MGSGSYDVHTRGIRSKALGYDSLASTKIFKSRKINNAMNPSGIKVRESRDSAEHPNSVAIIVALDVTGSMGQVPHELVKHGLPTMMGNIIQAGEPDPQVLFLGIGDHECDDSPLQVGQFESSDEKLDQWLTDIFLEGGGGGNAGESYLLAWYFAANHTSIDCFEKRQRKGLLFTIGDEPTLRKLPKGSVKQIMGDEGQYGDYTASELLAKAQEKYEVFHVHIKQTGAGQRQETIDGWKQLLADNLLIANKHEDVAMIIANQVMKSKPAGLVGAANHMPVVDVTVHAEITPEIPTML
jgi:hypothetical protein